MSWPVNILVDAPSCSAAANTAVSAEPDCDPESTEPPIPTIRTFTLPILPGPPIAGSPGWHRRRSAGMPAGPGGQPTTRTALVNGAIGVVLVTTPCRDQPNAPNTVAFVVPITLGVPPVAATNWIC
jgi:hypothetical protein